MSSPQLLMAPPVMLPDDDLLVEVVCLIPKAALAAYYIGLAAPRRSYDAH